MRTTLDIETHLLKEAKRRAVAEGTTLTAIVEEALRCLLAPRAPRAPFRLQLVTKRGRTLAGVDLADRDALYEQMEGRR